MHKMEVVRALIFIVLISFVHGMAKWQIINNDHTALGEATAILTREYLSNSSNTVVIIERCVHTGMHRVNTRILQHILTNLQETMTVQLYNGHSQNQPWEYHIFLVDGIEAFDDIKWSFPKTFHDRDFRFLIVLTRYTPDYLETLKRIFESCRRFKVYNANVLLNHPLYGVCMFKYNLFTKIECNRVQPYLYFRFDDGIHNLLEVFPVRLVNFWGCPLRITARINSPVLSFSGNYTNPVSEKYWDNLSGMDGELIKIISNILNFTINLLPIPEEKTFFDNKTGYGCFADLLKGKADIAIGGFSSSDPNRRMLTPSVIYHRTPVVFVIRSGRELDSISRLARPFSHEVWKQLAVCLICLTLGLLLLRVANAHRKTLIMGQSNRSPILNFLTVFLGYPMTRLPSMTSARYFLSLWFLMTLVIRNAYQGSLFDAFRTDKLVRLPSGYDELIQWNYKVIGSYYFSGSEIFPSDLIIPAFKNAYCDRLRQLEKTRGHFATVALRDNFLYYVSRNPETKLKLLPKSLYLHSASFFFQKHSIYATSINRHLKGIKYSGLMQRISRNHLQDSYLFGFSKKSGYVPQPITIFRIRGAFEIFGALLAFATLVFVIELLSVRLEKLQVIINWID